MLNKVSERVYYMDYVQQGDRPVLGLVVGDDCCLVIDGGNSKAHAEEFLSYVNELDVPPLKYLILTHWHWDHVWGMDTMNLINIVHKDSNERLDWMRKLDWTDEDINKRVKNGEEIEFCEEHIKIEHPSNDRKIVIPKAHIIFDSNIEIDLGGVKVRAEHVVADHSKDCCLVNIKDEKIVFMGDAMYLDMYNGPWSYSREKLYPLLDKLKSYEGSYYIPAHHPKYTGEKFSEFIDYIKNIGDLVGDSVNEEEVASKFKMLNGRKAKDEELEDIRGFLEGNKKRKFTKK